ncbi:serine/threonine-protein phosphatase 1 regulatory subunit 10 isoform X2 [Orussus abietinus]|uniref:serine/threonine-protein phosphatase 1 regulatory subunit 10 isoform X2 n=1 Tax=Orussus abietinus TaxID=222816 RepID=UPI000624FF25|nr:serine/threonine-protein phosphatase 1 regulatory subunit 10 isoform X2 [Orussus abietinus]
MVKPRIDPLSLLKCLSVLLGPDGGIKSKEEVHRLANLMTKFSKKLVSKCIYIQILKTTNTDLLSQFMGAGGWNLIHMWLTDGILAKNWALIQELLELLLLCPVDIERLKSNNCPKLIKGLSKEGSHQGVRILASRLVEQWLKIVKGEAAPNSVPAQIMTSVSAASGTTTTTTAPAMLQLAQQHATLEDHRLEKSSDDSTVNLLQEQADRVAAQVQVVVKSQTTAQPGQQHHHVHHNQQQPQAKRQSIVVVTSSSSQPPVPVYKITIRDGKQVLTKVETDLSNISNATDVEVNGDAGHEEEDAAMAQEDDGDQEGSALDQEEAQVDADLAEDTSSPEEKSMDKVDGAQANESSTVSADRVSAEAKVGTKIGNEVDVAKAKDAKEGAGPDSGKLSDKENRDSLKKDDKKGGVGAEKKGTSHHGSSTSKSSSKHSSSSGSHRSGSSSSHRAGSHKSGSGSSKSSTSKTDKSSREKEKARHGNSSNKHASSGKGKTDRDKEREKEKEKLKKDQAEKDKATLEKVQGLALSTKMGKIPKKKPEDEKLESSRKSSTESKENKDKTETRKSAGVAAEKKNISISIENRKNSQDTVPRPKTVKTFNSKFRSTGLEEEAKPPPPRSVKKPNQQAEKKVVPPKPLLSLKRRSPSPPLTAKDVTGNSTTGACANSTTTPPPDKKPKLSLESPPPADEKKGGIKLIPPKPKPMVLQESDMFMDALTASTKSKEPRKRKRRTSISKEGEAKKQELANSGNSEGHRDVTPPPTSPPSSDDKSPVTLKPNLKFYQDTLETDEEKEEKAEDDAKKDKEEESDERKEAKEVNDEDERNGTPTPEDDEDTKGLGSDEESSPEGSDSRKKDSGASPRSENRFVDGLKSVLLLQKRKGPKKSLKWKTDLESIRYFELDETERVNVTKTFTDMKQMEKRYEREAFQMARKLSTEDHMEEKTRWKPLIPVDVPPALVEPGKDSREKDVQYAREKGILQALYFNRSMIPDSAAEPDEERHHPMTDPKVIPLDDLTGNKESEKDFTLVPWPEPKTQASPTLTTNFHYRTFPHGQPTMMAPMGAPQGAVAGMGPMAQMPPMAQIPQQMMAAGGPGPMAQMGPVVSLGDMTSMPPPPPPPSSTGAAVGGGWRTGDGKVVVPDVAMNPVGFPQPGMDAPMGPPMMGGPPMYNQQEGFGMMGPEEMGYGNMPGGFQGPPGPMMFGPGPNFHGGPRPGGPMHAQRGRGGPGWYRGGGAVGGASGPGRGGGWRGGGTWRGSGKQPPVCRQFSKNGYCRSGDKCQYLHPGVNCPPY